MAGLRQPPPKGQEQADRCAGIDPFSCADRVPTRDGEETSTILVVDDELYARQLLTDMLALQGFRVISVARGEDVFAHLPEVDLVLLDAMLPDRDGWDICREIKQRYDRLLPVIMVTARTAPDDVVRTFEAGADDYVAKPFHAAELMARIGSRLRVHRVERELRHAADRLRALAEQNYALYQQASRDAEERQQLLKELDHRVRNNLAKITGLVGMARQRAPDETSQAVLAALENRLHAFLLVHDILRHKKYQGVPSHEIVERLAQRLRNAFRANGRIKLDVRCGEALLDERAAVSVALALNELLSNSLRHAFPGERTGTVAIHMSERDGEYWLEIMDDGIGMPEEVECVTGSGRSIVDAVVRGELGGRVEYLPAAKGTHVRLRFPSPAASQ
ncbi:MAG TPA: response regulator [Longimicrobiales bacterium]